MLNKFILILLNIILFNVRSILCSTETIFVEFINLSLECKWLEKNYIDCVLQKAMKDKIQDNVCSLEHVLWYHLECPDYAKKWDEPQGQAWIKRQIFNLLTVPYMNMRFSEMNLKKHKKLIVSDYSKKKEFIEYPEELKDATKPDGLVYRDIIDNKELRDKFFEGVTYEKDPVESKDE